MIEDANSSRISRRDLLTGGLVAFFLGALRQPTDKPSRLIPAGTGKQTVEATNGQIIIADDLETAASAVDLRPALLIISTGNWYIEEDDASAPTEINPTNITMDIIIADTIDAVEEQVQKYPTLGLSRQGNSVLLTEE